MAIYLVIFSTTSSRRRLFQNISRRLIVFCALFIFSAASCSSVQTNTEFRALPQSLLIFPREDIPAAIVNVNWANDEYMSLSGLTLGQNMPAFLVNISQARISSPLTFADNKLGILPPVKVSPDGKHMAFMVKNEGLVVSPFQESPLFDSIIKTGVLGLYTWSTDSNQIAILTIHEKTFDLYTYTVSEESLKHVFSYFEVVEEDVMFGDDPSWSSDGNIVAFTLEYWIDTAQGPDTWSDLFLYSFKENQLIRATSTKNTTERYPTWYPNSEILTYITVNGAHNWGGVDGKLVFSTKDGRCVKTLEGFVGIASPSWSPDGSQMAYISQDGIEILDTQEIIPQEYLSPESLCNASDK